MNGIIYYKWYMICRLSFRAESVMIHEGFRFCMMQSAWSQRLQGVHNAYGKDAVAFVPTLNLEPPTLNFELSGGFCVCGLRVLA